MEKCSICNTRYAQPDRQFCWPCGGTLMRNIQEQSDAHEALERQRKAQSDYEGLLAVTTKTIMGVKRF
jgi:hypothetical protein